MDLSPSLQTQVHADLQERSETLAYLIEMEHQEEIDNAEYKKQLSNDVMPL